MVARFVVLVPFNARRLIGAACLSAALIFPATAGTNMWTGGGSGCSGPYASWGEALACSDAKTPTPGYGFGDCGVGTIVDDATPPSLQRTSRAYYDSTPPLTCPLNEWTPRTFVFTDSCSSMSPARAWNATYGGCAQICVAPDTLNTQTGLCEPEGVPPSAPSNLSSVPTRAAITLTWSASTDNVAVTGYAVERCLGVACNDFAEVATTPGTTYPDSGLASKTTYRYRARAFDAAGNDSAYSAIAEATTPAISAEYIYDELGRVVLVTIASGASIVYSYDESGNVTAIIRAAP